MLSLHKQLISESFRFNFIFSSMNRSCFLNFTLTKLNFIWVWKKHKMLFVKLTLKILRIFFFRKQNKNLPHLIQDLERIEYYTLQSHPTVEYNWLLWIVVDCSHGSSVSGSELQQSIRRCEFLEDPRFPYCKPCKKVLNLNDSHYRYL